MSYMYSGERVYEATYHSNMEDHLIYLFHVATYKFALQYVSGKRVLDFGCGSGYGTAMIADSCSRIIGTDISSEAIRYATQHYSKSNLTFLTVDNIEYRPLPFREGFFDIVLSFQVIEHVHGLAKYLSEIKRVLKPGGLVIIATPNRDYRLLPFQKPWNRWHVKEYSNHQLSELLDQYFEQVEIFEMGGSNEILQKEIKRARRVMWITVPLTLPFIPESMRTVGLDFLKFLKSKFRRDKSIVPLEFGFDDSLLSVSREVKYSINLIAIGVNEPPRNHHRDR